MLKITAALLGNGDHVIVEIVEFPHQRQYRSLVYILDRLGIRDVDYTRTVPHQATIAQVKSVRACRG
jgi:hypothetical protein